MLQINPFADEREITSCVFCGNSDIESRDHAPSRVLLDEPYPENLPVVPACAECNQGFSQDEEYVACLIECVLAGTSDPEALARKKIARILRHHPTLAARLASARILQGGTMHFSIEEPRVRNVVLKLARAHAAFELHTLQLHVPVVITAVPFAKLTGDERNEFEASPLTKIWPEVGSRAMQRLAQGNGPNFSKWIIPQPGRYRYLAATTNTGTIIRMALSEYLACEVKWDVKRGE